MTINVGDLVIGLKADIARLQTDMNAAKSSVQGAMKDIESYVGFAKTAFLSLGGVLSVDAFKDVIAGAIEFKARLVDLSSQTGIGVTALGALGKTGKLTGTTLDDITAASAKLSKAIETQNEDSKGAAQAIAALGLNFNQFKQLKPEDQLLAVAKAMDGFADGTGKTAASMLLFGKTGATLLPFLRDLAERTDLNSRQTEEASRQAKAFEDNLKKLKAAGDEWKDQLANAMLPSLVAFTKQMVEAKTAGDKLGTIWSNVKDNLKSGDLDQQIATVKRLNDEVALASKTLDFDSSHTLLGFMVTSDKENLDKLRKQAAEASDVLKAMTEKMHPVARDRAAEMAAIYGGGPGGSVKPSVTGLDTTPNGPKQVDLYANLIKTVNERLAQQDAELDKGRQLSQMETMQAKSFTDIDAGIIKATASQRAYVAGLFAQGIAQEKAAKEREQDARDNEKTLDDAQRRLDSLQAETKAWQDQLDQFGLTREELQAVSAERDRYTAAQLKGRAAALDTIGAEGQLRDLYLAQAGALDKVAAQKDELAAKEARERNDPNAGAARALKDYLDTVKRAGDATYGAVQNSLRGLEDTTVSILGGSNAKQAARSWVNGVISEMQRLYVVKPLLNDIFNGGQGTGGSLLGSIGSIMGAVGSLFGGGMLDTGGSSTNFTGGQLPTAGGRATGGPVSAGQSYLVGERGPEILRMGNQAGSVTPNGGTPNIQIINQTGAAIGDTKTNKLPDGTLQLILQAAKSAIVADLHSGGSVAQAVSNTFQLNRASSVPRY